MLVFISKAITYIGGLIIEDPGASDDFLGNWNALTNDPTIADGSADDDQYYLVSEAGTQDLGSGPIVFEVSDIVRQVAGVWVNEGPAPQAQTDWNENNPASPSFLVNRPTSLTNGDNADSLHKHSIIQNPAGNVLVQVIGAVASIFTGAAERLRVLANGDLQLFNYLNTRNDGTVKDVPTYYPDASGIMQVGRVLPFSSTAVRTIGNVNQADTTYLTYHTHNVTVPEDGLYILDGKFRWSLNSIGDDFQSRILVDTVELATSLHKQEPKDAAGSGVLLEDLNNPGNFVNTGTSQRYLAPIFEAIPLTAGAHVIEFQFTADDSNQEPAVYDIVTRLTRDS